MEAVIIILKHATILQLSNSPKQALTIAEKDYQKANIDSKIQEHLKTFTPEDSVENFADFIMAIIIGLFMHSLITTISHLNLYSKQHREGFWRPIPVKFILLPMVEEHQKEGVGAPRLNGLSVLVVV